MMISVTFCINYPFIKPKLLCLIHVGGWDDSNRFLLTSNFPFHINPSDKDFVMLCGFSTLQVLFMSFMIQIKDMKRVLTLDSYSSFYCKHFFYVLICYMNRAHIPIAIFFWNIKVLYRANAFTWPVVLNRNDINYLLPVWGPNKLF